ncbi:MULTISPECIES: energy transducer TonB family protein [Acidiphilium]|uniref:Energy transducer TonB n=1 Tax=Acidiphilium iwatense TaxID=768198 RepID=A0ABS9DZ20_9PROT|nr:MULTISPECIES: energy transducer TonB [Acidiphilium]MCF3948000.1 energy transducer TonB [Acidiphilium iwatense]
MSRSGDIPPGLQERDLFARALGAALIVEILFVIGVVHFANQAGPVADHQPRIMKIQMMAPQPKPRPLPKPPKPMPPLPKPLPPPPLPMAPPKPPPPTPIPRPLPKPRPIAHPQPVKPIPHVATPKPQPPPQQPVVSAAEQENATERYAALVHQSVQDDLRVPRQVAMMRLHGITTVAIRVAPSGTLLGDSILRSSGFPPIDNAALAAVRATRFPPFSARMSHHPITFTLRVDLHRK